MNKLRNKKIIAAVSFSVVIITILGFIAVNTISDINAKNINQEGAKQEKVEKAPLDNKEEVLGVHETGQGTGNQQLQNQQSNAQPVENISQNNINDKQNSPESTQQCILTLKAVILRPYEFIYHLGDKSDKITGSYEATCIEPNEVTYEWYIRGPVKPLEYTLFSTTAKPDFSNYTSDYSYDVIYRVKAKGLSSEVKTWVMISEPYVEPPNTSPMYINLYKPFNYQYLEKLYLTDYSQYIVIEGKADARDRQDGALIGESLQWFVVRYNGERTLIGTGENITANYTLPSCEEYVFSLVVRATDSKGLWIEKSIEIQTIGGPCQYLRDPNIIYED